jgi:Dinucleotide-utilizing enzymes involved in molybdopterin and thiamine biosynthesis family 1
VTELFKPDHNIDFERRFGGVRRLYGPIAFERFQQAHVCVIGIGGVGSWVVEALARSAIGRLTLIDPDHIAESNINRQLHALTGEEGKAKVQAMRERILAINPRCKISGVEEFLSEENLDALLGNGFDFVVDAIDSARVKAALIHYCKRNKIRLACVGGAGGQRDPGLARVDDLARTTQDPLLAKVRARLRKDYGFPRDTRKKFGVDCVYSVEPLVYPTAEGGVCFEKPEDAHIHGLNCAGFGSSVCVTSVFGMLAAAAVLNGLAAK